MELTIGFSPCPNDTFIFDALVHQKIDTKGISFKPVLADVEALNLNAVEGKLDITKLSYHAYAYVSNIYALMDSGSALGQNCGPLLISTKKLNHEELQNSVVAIPGKWTTANFLLSLAYPEIQNKKELIFYEIENAIVHGKVNAGVIIHENRFTYKEKGLKLIQDLGEWWETETGLPIPLGGIAIKRNIDIELAKTVQNLIRESILFAFKHPEESKEYVRCHAQEMDEEVVKQHIGLYVNQYSVSLGEKGKKAVETMFEKGFTQNIIPKNEVKSLFID